MPTYRIKIRPFPAVRMTQRSKHGDPRASEYMNWKTRVGWAAKSMMDPFPKGSLLSIRAAFIYKTGTGVQGDFDNLAKGLTDALQTAGIIPNDRKIKIGETVVGEGSEECIMFDIRECDKEQVAEAITRMFSDPESAYVNLQV